MFLLPPAIQKHYAISGGQQSCVTGLMTIDYPASLFPLIWLAHLCGGLALWRGGKVDPRGKVLRLRRRIALAAGDGARRRQGRLFPVADYYAADRELLETVEFGFGLRLKLQVCDGDLLYTSAGYVWRWRKLQLAIPDWLCLGTAEIREHALSDRAFELSFTLRHPLLGVVYRYGGEFSNQTG